MKRQVLFTICVVLALAVTLCGARPVFAQTVVTTIPVGDAPSDIAVNPNTDLIYVANRNSSTVSVIDGSLDTVIATIALTPTFSSTMLVAVNPSTNRIYAVRGSLLFVIDGGSNTVTAVTSLGGFLPANIEDIAVNANTNRIYALDRFFGVQVIDGSTNAVIARISGVSSIEGKGITINPITNRIYVSDFETVLVIDGDSNTTVTTVPSGFFLSSVAVNPDTNRVYVSGLDSFSFTGGVSVIDGGTNAVITSLSLPTFPSDVAVNPSTNRIYIPDQVGGIVSVIDGHTNSLVDIVTVGGAPSSVTVNFNTNRIYVANANDDTVSVIEDSGNLPPAAEAGGPYSVNEGDSVTVNASGTDPENGSLTYAWDLDNNGSFETPGQTVTFSAVGLAAPDTKTIQVQVTDEGGLTATDQADVTIIHNFSNFFAPVDPFPTFNAVKAGASVPVRFSLSGDQGLNIFAAGYPKSEAIECDSTAQVDGIEETVAAGNSNLSYDPATDTYTYVWKTNKLWANTCRQLILQLDDGTFYRANFNFTK